MYFKNMLRELSQTQRTWPGAESMLLTRAQVERSLTFQNLSELKNPSISFIET